MGTIPVELLPWQQDGECAGYPDRQSPQKAGLRWVDTAAVTWSYSCVQHGWLWPSASQCCRGRSSRGSLYMAFLISPRLVTEGDYGKVSTMYFLTCGVPQAALLSLILFDIYIHPLAQLVWNFRLWGQHAETQLYWLLDDHPGITPSNLFMGWEDMMGWVQKSRLNQNMEVL